MTIAREWLGKQLVFAETNNQATVEELLEAVFPMSS
jgi:hypothetical protein